MLTAHTAAVHSMVNTNTVINEYTMTAPNVKRTVLSFLYFTNCSGGFIILYSAYSTVSFAAFAASIP